jgi:hypothetical protein
VKSQKKCLITANGKITCLRCTALSKRTGAQCGRPALKTSSTQKCQFHGGKSTGPKTVYGRQKISKAQVIHGNETLQKRLERSKQALWLSQAHDVMRVLKMTDAPRHRGRKPNGYIPITTIEEVRHWVAQNVMHSVSRISTVVKF